MQSVAEKQQIPLTGGTLIEQAIDQAQPGVSLLAIAVALFESKNSAIKPLIRDCAIRQLLLLLRRERARRAPKLQLYLPGIEAPMPRSVPQAEGSARCPLLKATYEDLRRYRQQLQVKARQPSPRILQIKELMKLMRKHPTHGITVGEVLDLEGIQPKLPD